MKPTPEYIKLAREMKALGFPQPEFERGQIWVVSEPANTLLFFTRLNGKCAQFWGDIDKPTEGSSAVWPENWAQLTYLPTEEDIIRDAKDRLGQVNFITMYADNVFWVVTEKRNSYDLASESMVVALARTWLEAAKLPKQ